MHNREEMRKAVVRLRPLLRFGRPLPATGWTVVVVAPTRLLMPEFLRDLFRAFIRPASLRRQFFFSLLFTAPGLVFFFRRPPRFLQWRKEITKKCRVCSLNVFVYGDERERERIVVYWPNPMKRMKLTVYKVNIVTRYTAPPLILWFF